MSGQPKLTTISLNRLSGVRKWESIEFFSIRYTQTLCAMRCQTNYGNWNTLMMKLAKVQRQIWSMLYHAAMLSKNISYAGHTSWTLPHITRALRQAEVVSLCNNLFVKTTARYYKITVQLKLDSMYNMTGLALNLELIWATLIFWIWRFETFERWMQKKSA